MPEPPQTPGEAQNDLPITGSFESHMPIWLRDSNPPPVSLETTGVTQHPQQREFWSKTTILKDSIVAKLRSIGADNIAEPLARCHTEQSFAQCNGCHSVKTFWNRCENFYCPVCQPTLARERALSIGWWTREVEQPKHVVLTVRNTQHLTAQYFQWFKDCLTKLRRRKFARNWLGGIYSIEITCEEKGWHLHAHLLVNARWIDPRELSRQWAEIVGQDFAIVYVKDARQRDYLKEVCKYAVKGTELAKWTPLQIVTFVNAVSGKRTFGVFGELYGLRTRYRDWLKVIAGDRRKCQCGCSQWKIYDAQSWDWRCQTYEPLTFSRPPPEPEPVQPRLNLDVTQ